MVDRFFDDVQNYVPIHIDNSTADFGIPTDRKMRYLWFKELQISHRYLWQNFTSFLFFHVCGQIEVANKLH